MTAPALSVIIPTYNEEKIIAGTLEMYDEGLRREFGIELIISDGGSTDRTIELAGAHADKIAVHKDTERQTIADGRNKGAEMAAAEVLVFINADTRPEDMRGFFEKITEWKNGSGVHSGAAAIACTVQPFPEDKKKRDSFFYFTLNNYFRFLNIIGIGMGRGECQIVRKKIFDEAGGYNCRIVAGEDFDLYKRIAKSHKVAFARDITVLESPRRFRKYGYTRTIGLWFLNSVSVMMRGRSLSKIWDAVR